MNDKIQKYWISYSNFIYGDCQDHGVIWLSEDPSSYLFAIKLLPITKNAIEAIHAITQEHRENLSESMSSILQDLQVITKSSHTCKLVQDFGWFAIAQCH